MKRLFPLILFCAAPLFGQELPQLAPLPLIPLAEAQEKSAETNNPPQPLAPAAPVQPAASRPEPLPLSNGEPLPVPNKELEKAAKAVRPFTPSEYQKPKKEISLSEYKAARRRLYEQLRASESMYRRSGSWFDLAVSSFDFSMGSYYYYDYMSGNYRRSGSLSRYGIYTSFGRVSKGFMYGLSFQWTLEEPFTDYSGSSYRIPNIYEAAGVLGYRIAPDNIVGFRMMLHVGYGGTFHGRTATGPGISYPISYVLIMPEIKLDFKVYKTFTISLGVAYKASIFVGKSEQYASELQSYFGFNGLEGLRTTIGLGYNY